MKVELVIGEEYGVSSTPACREASSTRDTMLRSSASPRDPTTPTFSGNSWESPWVSGLSGIQIMGINLRIMDNHGNHLRIMGITTYNYES